VPARHLISLQHLGSEALAELVRSSVDFASGRRTGEKPLLDKVIGVYFRKSSTRTRTSFTVAAMKLGAHTIAYGPDDLQLSTGETLEDTGRVLSGYLEALVVRTNDAEAEMGALARQDDMAVINAMGAAEHPTQAVADLATIQGTFGHLEGVHILYVGEGNNTASALALACGLSTGLQLTLISPRGYGLPGEALRCAREFASQRGSSIEQHDRIDDAPTGVDVVYTTRWQTMGVPKPNPDWRQAFLPYSVTPELMARVSRPQGTIFMHDLPAVRGDDVHDEVLDGPQSLAWCQARYKMFSAMAILEWCTSEDTGP